MHDHVEQQTYAILVVAMITVVMFGFLIFVMPPPSELGTQVVKWVY